MNKINDCPNCGKKSLIKVSRSELKKQDKVVVFLVEVIKKYSFDCFNKDCNYSSGIIGGDNLEDKIKKWWKGVLLNYNQKKVDYNS